MEKGNKRQKPVKREGLNVTVMEREEEMERLCKKERRERVSAMHYSM